MKTLLILIYSLSFSNPVVNQLNLLARQDWTCRKGKIEAFGIDCAGKFNVNFLEAKLLSKKKKKYELIGQLIYDDFSGDFVSGARIAYGHLKDDVCNRKDIGFTDSIGKFKIQLNITKDQFITFYFVGLKPVTVLLNID